MIDRWPRLSAIGIVLMIAVAGVGLIYWSSKYLGSNGPLYLFGAVIVSGVVFAIRGDIRDQRKL